MNNQSHASNVVEFPPLRIIFIKKKKNAFQLLFSNKQQKNSVENCCSCKIDYIYLPKNSHCPRSNSGINVKELFSAINTGAK